MLKDKLQIFLITYNRYSYLKNTFEQIFAENSPIKDFDITILDNKSLDGTFELIEEYKLKFPNIRHIVNNRNIGGNANIAKAFELAQKEYVWVLCDDDYYDFNNWNEVETAIDKSFDTVIVSTYNIFDRSSLSDKILQLAFLPAGIYKTSLITDETMKNIYDNISNFFPHLALAVYIANTSKSFYTVNNPVVINCDYYNYINNINDDKHDRTYIRGYDKTLLYPDIQNKDWFIAFVNSISLLNDKNSLNNCLKSTCKYPLLVKNMFEMIRLVVYHSMQDKRSINLYYDFFTRVNLPLKILMILYRYSPICFYLSDSGINLQLFNKYKMRLIPNLKKCFR